MSLKTISLCFLAILSSRVGFTQHWFGFEGNNEFETVGIDEITLKTTVDDIELTVRSDNNGSGNLQITQVSSIDDRYGTKGNFVTTSHYQNTVHFEFSEPVYLATIHAFKLGTGIMSNTIINTTDTTQNFSDFVSTTGSSYRLGWENITSISMSIVSDQITCGWDHIGFIPMSEYNADNWGIKKTYVPDDEFEQKLIDYGFDSAIDDSILTKNIIFEKLLDLRWENVESLEGIKDFHSLETFYFGYANAAPLGDLDLSNSPNLEYLACGNADISSMDISSCDQLSYVSLLNSGISNILFAHTNDNLETLMLNGNNLDVLDFSEYTALNKLEVESNELTSLNIKNGRNSAIQDFSSVNNPFLSCIQVDNVNYANNNFTSVDDGVSFNTDCGSILADLVTYNIDSQPTYFIYPYPIQNTLYIESNQNHEMTFIGIMDLQGRLLMKASNAEINNNRMDVGILNDGSYFLLIESKNQKSHIFKIIKGS